MKTSMLLAIFAIGGVVAFASLAAAAGTNMSTLNAQDGSGNGMMARNGGCHGSDGQSAQYQYRYDDACPGGCQAELRNEYSWSYGEGNMTCGGAGCQFQGECPGTCDSCHDWNYSWNWDYSQSGQ